MNTWRSKSVAALVPILNEARIAIAAGNLKLARRIVKAAYPFGLREYTPYKIWCEEVRHFLPGLYPSRKPSQPSVGGLGIGEVAG